MAELSIVVCSDCLQEWGTDHAYTCPGPFHHYRSHAVRVTLELPDHTLRQKVQAQLEEDNDPGIPAPEPGATDLCAYCGRIRSAHDENGSKYQSLNGEHFRCKVFIEACAESTNGAHLFRRYENEPESDECYKCGKLKSEIGGRLPTDRPLLNPKESA